MATAIHSVGSSKRCPAPAMTGGLRTSSEVAGRFGDG